mgnify:CR=1 FL=1
MKQNNKIVLISGVSRGIGNAVALRFLKENSIVFGISRKKIIKKNLLLGYKNFFHLKGNINNVSFLFKCKLSDINAPPKIFPIVPATFHFVKNFLLLFSIKFVLKFF